MRLLRRLRELERATRLVDPETEAVMRRRWAELPEHVRTPAACVQHSVLDPAENAALRTMLPMPTGRAGA